MTEIIEKEFEKVLSNKDERLSYEFSWTCSYCGGGQRRPYELAKISHRNNVVRIYSATNKTVNIHRDGVIEIVCPKCFSMNRSTKVKKVDFFCKLFQKNGTDKLEPASMNCSNFNGCGNMQLAKLLVGEDDAVISIPGSNQKIIRMNNHGIVIVCPECREQTWGQWNHRIRKFWENLIPEQFVPPPREGRKQAREVRKPEPPRETAKVVIGE